MANKYQGPVRPGDSERKFRRTGKTKPKFSTKVRSKASKVKSKLKAHNVKYQKRQQMKRDVKKATGTYAGEPKRLRLKPGSKVTSKKVRKGFKRSFQKKSKDSKGRAISKARHTTSLLGAFGINQRSLKQQPRRRMSPQASRKLQQIKSLQNIKNTNQKSVMNSFQEEKKQQQVRDLLKSRDLSPSARAQLQSILNIQNKGKRDDLAQQRRNREKKIIERSMVMTKAHENLNKVTLDFSGVNNEDNILMADNIFKEDIQDHILKPKRLNIMQTKEANNNLKF